MSKYVHGTDPDEQARLTRMNEFLNAECLKRIAPAPGGRILDVGSGLGQMTRALARAAGPSAQVVGVELSDEQRTEAARQAAEAGESALVEWRAGAATPLPLATDERGSFDLVHARFILEHLTNPDEAVAEMVRACKPGGRIVLFDDDHDLLRLWPEVPGFDAVWRAYIRTYDRRGQDPYIGRRLPQLLWNAGAVPTKSDAVFFGACAGAPEFSLLVKNLIEVIDRAAGLDELVPVGDLADVVRRLDRWAERPDASIWYFVSFAEGRVPER